MDEVKRKNTRHEERDLNAFFSFSLSLSFFPSCLFLFLQL